MKLLKFNTIIFVLIIVLGLGLRLYKLDSVPPGLTWDEAALGYNAYSILHTGKDEYGNFFPLTLVSFGDHKPALYTYLDIPFVGLFGLNEWAVRLPSVLAGMGFIILCFLLTREIFKNTRLSLAVAFFAAVSPLSIQFSRVGFESNVAVFLNLLGFYLFLKGLKNSKYFFGSAVSFVLSMLCYQGSKIFVPIILIGLFLFFRKQVKISRDLFLSLAIVTAAGVAIYFSTFLFGHSDRLTAQNLFAYKRNQAQIDLISTETGLKPGSFQFEILHGEWWEFIRTILSHYLIYFSPDTLIIKGDYSERHSVPDLGILNFYALLLVPFGFYFLWLKSETEKKIILFWLFTAIIPAVFSRDLISMVRALNLMFPLAILEGFGFYYLINKIAGALKLNKSLVLGFLGIVIAINLIIYLDFYFVHLPRENSEGWLYGYKQIVSQLPNTSKYDRVVFTDEYGQPYIYYLFYKRYSPEKFQSLAKLEQDGVDVGTVRKVDNIEFRKINWPVDRGLENTLLIGTEEEMPEHDVRTEKKSKQLYKEDFLDGKPALKIVENGYE